MNPFAIQEGEAIIAQSHREFGEAHGNYEEFRFFTGLRQSEQFELLTTDCNLENGEIKPPELAPSRHQTGNGDA